MPKQLSIALAQLKYTVGDLHSNFNKSVEAYKRASGSGIDLLILPELSATGYPPEDLILNFRFQQETINYLNKLIELTLAGDTAIVMGGVMSEDSGILYNTAYFIYQGMIKPINKTYLPNYGVFDEKRIFTPGRNNEVIEYKGAKLGILICEDLWHNSVVDSLVLQGADILITINASPFERGKNKLRRSVVSNHVNRHNKACIYLNNIGGQDNLVFDGDSFVVDAQGVEKVSLSTFVEDYLEFLWCDGVIEGGRRCVATPATASVYQAILLGIRDYVHKNGFNKVVLGLSGGIDSALVAAMAVDALGSQNVQGVFLPYIYTAEESYELAQECAHLLGIKLQVINIENAVDSVNNTLASIFADTEDGIAEENIQSRMRGMILMALSNKFGHLLLTTGNKSELAVGYATLYGDMCGAFNPLKDVYKTEVYELSKWRNTNSYVIPEGIINRKPTAELKFGQFDEDSLPPYEVLDKILFCLIERDMPISEIVGLGYDYATVCKVKDMLYKAEYKRRQSAPGPKVSTKCFNVDRRYPITNRYKEN
jgi:NAD+ synthase